MSESNQTGRQEPAEAENPTTKKASNRTFIMLFCVSTFCYWAALYVYSPFLPVYAQSMGASMSVVGVVVSSYALPQLLLRIPLGMWSDAIGKRKPLVMAGFLMVMGGAIGLAYSPDPFYLTLSRTATGVGAALWVIVSVYFVSFYPPDKTGRAVGFINFLQLASLMAASLGGGVIAEAWGPRQTFFAGALLGVLSVVALLPVPDTKVKKQASFRWQDFTEVAFNRHLLIISAMAILQQFGMFATVFGFVPVYAVKIGASSVELGTLTMLATLAAALSALLAPRLTEKKGYTFTLLLGSLAMAISLVVVPFISSVFVLEIDQLVTGVGRGLLGTTLMAQAILAVPAHQRATAMGVYQAVYSVGMLLGPLLSGFVADSQGLEAVFYLCAAVSLAIGGVAYLPVGKGKGK